MKRFREHDVDPEAVTYIAYRGTKGRNTIIVQTTYAYQLSESEIERAVNLLRTALTRALEAVREETRNTKPQ